MGNYTKSSVNRTAKPRSERLREVGREVVKVEKEREIIYTSSGGGGGGTGTVTSVGLSMPSAFNVSPSSPITTSGTFTVSVKNGYVIPSTDTLAGFDNRITALENAGFITSISSSDVTSALGYTPASQSGLNTLSGTVQGIQGDVADINEEIEGNDGILDRLDALEQGGGGGGSVVSWGSQGTSSNTINLTVNGTTKTLVQKAGYDNLDDRVTSLENNPSAVSVTVNGNNYAPVSGVITLPNYPDISGLVSSSDLETALEDYVDLGNVQTITALKKFTGGIGFQAAATASSGLRIKVVESTINGVTKSRIHIYGDVVIHGEVANDNS